MPFQNAPRTRAPLAVAGLIVALLMAAPSRVETQSGSSPDVKAAFLMNFAKFVAWPQHQFAGGRALVIGVVGDDAIADSLSRLAAGKAVDGRAIVVTRLAAEDDPAKTHILFISDSERSHIPDLVKRIGTSSVLTVSDAKRFCVIGGIIQLRNEDDRIRFDVNLDRAQSAALVVNSKLLALAGAVNPAKND